MVGTYHRRCAASQHVTQAVVWFTFNVVTLSKQMLGFNILEFLWDLILFILLFSGQRFVFTTQAVFFIHSPSKC